MVQPKVVQGFLDVAGHWNPALLGVMGGALLVSVIAFQLKKPNWKARHETDRRLIAGALIFGAGWGLIGFCPGPALAALLSGQLTVILFVVAMIIGFWAASFLD